MIQVTYDSAQLQTATNRLICRQALERGWTVSVPYLPSPHMFIDRGDGKLIHLFSATPPKTSFAAAKLVNDKFTTYQVLKSSNIIQLDTMLLEIDDRCVENAANFLKRHKRIVVKPIDGAHGRGVTTDITDSKRLKPAIESALKGNISSNSVLLQGQFEAESSRDIRVLVINGEAVAAIERIPARVIGDGEHTIEHLIAIENASAKRGEPYHSKLSVIDIEQARTYLNEEIARVPKNGEVVRVLGIANYGAGGELVDVTDDIATWLKEECIKVADVLNLPVAGIDYLINTSHKSLSEINRRDAALIEVNKCPAIAIHDEPTVGQSRNVAARYLDFISTL